MASKILDIIDSLRELAFPLLAAQKTEQEPIDDQITATFDTAEFREALHAGPSTVLSLARDRLAYLQGALSEWIPEEQRQPQIQPLLSDAARLLSEDPEVQVLAPILEQLPTFRYVGAEWKYNLRGKTPLSELANRSLGDDPAIDTVLRLLQLAEIRVDELSTPSDVHRLRRLREASERLTEKFRSIWSQGRGDFGLPRVSFRLNVDAEHLTIMIQTLGGHDGFPDSRSHGFQWYLTFYLNLALAAEDEGRSSVLLLDEPGVFLHPLAQKDLLTRMTEMADHCQIIYATHLPDLVDLEHPESWRLVRLTEGEHASTMIDNPDSSKRGVALEVISKALYTRPGLGLPFWPLNLLVEGASDREIIDVVSRILSQQGLTQYAFLSNGDVLIFDAQGVKSYKGFARMIKAPGRRICALFDSDDEGNRARKSLIETHALDEGETVRVGEVYAEGQARDLEDLLGFTLCLRAIKRAYSEQLPDGFSLTRPERSAKMALGKSLQLAFDQTVGGSLDLKLDKWQVARAAKELLIDNPSLLDSDHLDRFKALFDLIGHSLNRLPPENPADLS